MSIYKFLSDLLTIFAGYFRGYSSKRFIDFEDNDEEEIIFKNDDEEVCECNLCYTFSNITDFVTTPFRKCKNI